MKSSASTNGFFKQENRYEYMMCFDFDSKNDYLNDLYYKEEERIYEDLCCVTFSRQFPEVPYDFFTFSVVNLLLLFSCFFLLFLFFSFDSLWMLNAFILFFFSFFLMWVNNSWFDGEEEARSTSLKNRGGNLEILSLNLGKVGDFFSSGAVNFYPF